MHDHACMHTCMHVGMGFCTHRRMASIFCDVLKGSIDLLPSFRRGPEQMHGQTITKTAGIKAAIYARVAKIIVGPMSESLETNKSCHYDPKSDQSKIRADRLIVEKATERSDRSCSYDL